MEEKKQKHLVKKYNVSTEIFNYFSIILLNSKYQMAERKKAEELKRKEELLQAQVQKLKNTKLEYLNVLLND